MKHPEGISGFFFFPKLADPAWLLLAIRVVARGGEQVPALQPCRVIAKPGFPRRAAAAQGSRGRLLFISGTARGGRAAIFLTSSSSALALEVFVAVSE